MLIHLFDFILVFLVQVKNKIFAGDEIFVSYGDSWFHDRGIDLDEDDEVDVEFLNEVVGGLQVSVLVILSHFTSLATQVLADTLFVPSRAAKWPCGGCWQKRLRCFHGPGHFPSQYATITRPPATAASNSFSIDRCPIFESVFPLLTNLHLSSDTISTNITRPLSPTVTIINQIFNFRSS